MFGLKALLKNLKKDKYVNSNESFILINNIWFDPIDKQFVYLITYTEDKAQSVVEFISGFNSVHYCSSVNWILGNGGYVTEGQVHEGGKSETIYHNRYYILFRFSDIKEIVSYIKSLDNEVLDKVLNDYCNRVHSGDANISETVRETGVFIGRRFVGVPLNYNKLIDEQSNLSYILERVPKCFTVYDVIQVSCKKIEEGGCVELYNLSDEEIKKYYPNYDASLSECPPILLSVNDDENDEIKGYLEYSELDSFFTDDIYRFSPLDLQEMDIDEVLNDDDDDESESQ